MISSGLPSKRPAWEILFCIFILALDRVMANRVWFLFSLVVVLGAVGNLKAQEPEARVLFQGATVRFADVEQGKKSIGAADDFVKCLSSFDRAARLRSSDPVDQESFLKHAAEQVETWTAGDVKKLSDIVAKVDAMVRQLNLQFSLPDEILFIKTTGMEEAGPGAPYTRETAIVMPGDVIKNSDPDRLSRLFLHELFHVLSRNEPKIREPLYKLIGFQPCNSIEYPPALVARKLTNPDAHHFDSYVEVKIGDSPVKILPLTLARDASKRDGGLLANVTVEFLELEGEANKLSPKMVDGKPVLHAMPAVMNDYFKKIGRNTNYIIHPEEILADNFSMAIVGKKNAPNADILKSILKYFAK